MCLLASKPPYLIYDGYVARLVVCDVKSAANVLRLLRAMKIQFMLLLNSMKVKSKMLDEFSLWAHKIYKHYSPWREFAS